MENPDADLSALMADDDRRRPRLLLEPWVRKNMKRTGLHWRLHHVREIFYLRGKLFKRWLKGLFKGVLSGLSYRTAEHVTRSYNDKWHSWQWWQPDERVNAKKLYMNWDDEGLVLFLGGYEAMQVDKMIKLFEVLKPQTVLEIGAGSGANLITMSTVLPEILFTGIELTEGGVAKAKSYQEMAEVPAEAQAYCPQEMKDKSAHRRVLFQQGDACKLPFEDNSFDIVFSCNALEQMELIRKQAISEMVRVARHGVLMVETFSELNTTAHMRLTIRARNFFNQSISGLSDYGLTPRYVFSDWPQKTLFNVGMVYSSVAP